MNAPRAPMRITAIRIHNFRAIDELELSIDAGSDAEAGALVLAGANGCGKTSVLEAILVALGRSNQLPEDSAPPNEWVRQGGTDFRASVEVLVAGKRARCEAVLGDFTVFDGTKQPSMLTLRPVESDDDPRTWITQPQGNVDFISARREPVGLGEAASGAPSGRRSTREERRLFEMKKRIANESGRRSREAIFKKITDFYATFAGREWRLDVVYASREPGAEIVPVLCDGALPVGENGEPLTWDRIVAGDAAPVRAIPIDRLSSGQMALLALAYPFVFGPPLDVVLIDEPEQHLHPSFQRALLPALRELSPQTQFIVATHSPQVLDSVASYERVKLGALDDRQPRKDAAE